VQTLTRPGGNLTGQTVLERELTEKRLELLIATLGPNRAATPECVVLLEAQRGVADPESPLCVAVLWRPNNSSAAEWAGAEAAAQKLGIALISAPADNFDELEALLADAKQQGAGAVFVFENPLLLQQNKTVAEIAVRYRLPLFGASRQWTQVGALEAFTPSYAEIFRRAAEQAIAITKGANPAEMPVERPTRFEHIENTSTATALGLEIPDTVMQQVTEVTH
jgi:putative ABC transport system substrate-binding protein